MTAQESPETPPPAANKAQAPGNDHTTNARFGLATLIWTIVGTGVASVMAISTLVITLYSWLDSDITTLRAELRTDITDSRKELRADIGKFEAAVRSDFDDVRGRINGLQTTAASTGGRVSNIEGQITGISASVAEINAEITSLQQTTTKTDAVVSRFEGRFEAFDSNPYRMSFHPSAASVTPAAAAKAIELLKEAGFHSDIYLAPYIIGTPPKSADE